MFCQGVIPDQAKISKRRIKSVKVKRVAEQYMCKKNRLIYGILSDMDLYNRTKSMEKGQKSLPDEELKDYGPIFISGWLAAYEKRLPTILFSRINMSSFQNQVFAIIKQGLTNNANMDII